MKKTIFLLVLLSLFSCTGSDKNKKESDIFEKKRINPNAEERAREAADKNPLFGSGKKSGNNTYDFATSNPLWRATLKTLDFIPLSTVDYAGGIVITDWYGNEGVNSNQIKIKIQFLSDQLSVASIEVKGHKKECMNSNCTIVVTDEIFNQNLKEKIFENARKISISDRSKK